MPDNTPPPPPEKPTANECCGSGCVPCIFDYYYDAFEKWNEKHGRNWAKANSIEEIIPQ